MTKPVLSGLMAMCLATLLAGQQRTIPITVPPPGFGPMVGSAPPAPQPAKPTPQANAPAQAPAGTAAQAPAITQAAREGSVFGQLSWLNASLTEVIDQLARELKINYVLDPRVKGGVYLNTYGEAKNIDPKNLLDMILRINGFAMIQVGDIYRIVPTGDMSHLPMPPESKSNSKDIPVDDAPMLNLVFLKYATAEELAKVLAEFIGEGAVLKIYPAANLLFILDSHRNMRRTMELVSMFDSDILANQRVQLYEVKNGRPSDIADELKKILGAISMNEKTQLVRFLPVDRINTIIAVAPNPGAFENVGVWLKKLDIPIKSSGGAMDTYVYRVKYSRAECIAGALMQLYMPFSGNGGGYGGGYGGGGYGQGQYGGGQYGGGGYGGGGYGGGQYGGGGYGGGGYGGGNSTIGGANAGLGVGGGCGGSMGGGQGGYGGGGYGGGYGGGGYGNQGGYGGGYAPQIPQSTGSALPGGTGAASDLTGSYLGNARGTAETASVPRIIPNPLDNSLLIQATPSQYQGILKLLAQIDIPPRQILLEAKIYEVSLTGAFASGVSAYLQKLGQTTTQSSNGSTNTIASPHNFLASLANGSTFLSAGAMVGASRELLGFLGLQENTTRARVLAAPSLIATDSIPASITVGNEVPTLTAQAAGGVQVGGNSTFAQSIQSRQTGVTLNVMARVNPSGIVTLIINQDVSAPQPPAAGAGIQSPSFSNRSVQTQITMQDGDTIAIGGIINESTSSSSAGIPLLHRIPYIGTVFGSHSISKDRTELIVFMTPHVIYDNADLLEASDELKGRLKKLKKYVRE